jgi:hypothetical protein
MFLGTALKRIKNASMQPAAPEANFKHYSSLSPTKD